MHLVGASGSGTTTLGRAVAQHLGCPHFDTDDYFWVPTDPRFVRIRPVEERHGSPVERSRQMHECWLAKLPCPVLRLESADDVETRLWAVVARLAQR